MCACPKSQIPKGATSVERRRHHERRATAPMTRHRFRLCTGLRREVQRAEACIAAEEEKSAAALGTFVSECGLYGHCCSGGCMLFRVRGSLSRLGGVSQHLASLSAWRAWMTSAGRPFGSIDPFVLAAKAEIDKESKPNSGRIESRGSPTTRYGV